MATKNGVSASTGAEIFYFGEDMKKRDCVFILKTIFVFQLIFFWSGQVGESRASQDLGSGRIYNRIISMSPGVTETLFAIGLGKAVVGVTRYCTYPPEVETRTRVGGFYDPSYETIVSLKPDLVILLVSHQAIKVNLEKLGLKILMVENNRIEDICRSIKTIGNFCRAEEKAEELVENLKERIMAVKKTTANLSRPKVMISVDRNTGTQLFSEVYVAGKNIFYDELIELAGGINVCVSQNIRYPVLSGEGIIRLNPQVIIDIVPDYKKKGLKKEVILKEWNRFSFVEAVKNKRVYVFGEDFTAVPGPRFVLTLEALAKALHPEALWEK